jgi:hypothetical protein
MTILPANDISGDDICKGIRDSQIRQTFSCMGLFNDPTAINSVGRIDVIHRLTYLSAPFGGTADPSIHAKLYGIVGDIMTGQQVAKVVIPSEAFDATPSTRISSDQVFNAAASNGTLPDTYGPFPTAGVDNTVAKTRNLCFITPYIAALILGSQVRTPRGILELLGQALGGAVKYEPIFKWLRIAHTSTANHQALTTRLDFAPAPNKQEINELIMTAVSQDLPMMGQAPIHLVGQQITNAVGHFTATFIAQNEADRLRRSESSQAKVMTLAKKFTYQAAPLRKLLQVTDLDDAPPVWKEIAEHNTKQVRQILQTALDATCYKLHLKPPILHQTLARIIIEPSSWRCSDGPDNVLQGLSIFHVLHRPPSEQLERKKAVVSYDLAMSTGSSMTSADTIHFNNPGHVATVWVEPVVAKTTLKHMWALCATIMGSTHTVTMGLQLALQRWEQYEDTLHSKYACAPDTWTMEILFWFHRQLSHWIELQYHSDAPVAFVIDELFSDISLCNNWSRGMPTEYIPARLLLAPTLPSLVNGLTPSLVSGLTSTGSGLTTTPPGGPRLETVTEDLTVYQPDNEKVARLTAYAAQQNNRRIHAIIATAAAAGHTVPTDAQGGHFCMVYHILGRCNQQCRRSRNHRQLTDAEVTSLATWCAAAF